jgi:hypothetical protein
MEEWSNKEVAVEVQRKGMTCDKAMGMQFPEMSARLREQGLIDLMKEMLVRVLKSTPPEAVNEVWSIALQTPLETALETALEFFEHVLGTMIELTRWRTLRRISNRSLTASMFASSWRRS